MSYSMLRGWKKEDLYRAWEGMQFGYKTEYRKRDRGKLIWKASFLFRIIGCQTRVKCFESSNSLYWAMENDVSKPFPKRRPLRERIIIHEIVSNWAQSEVGFKIKFMKMAVY